MLNSYQSGLQHLQVIDPHPRLLKKLLKIRNCPWNGHMHRPMKCCRQFQKLKNNQTHPWTPGKPLCSRSLFFSNANLTRCIQQIFLEHLQYEKALLDVGEQSVLTSSPGDFDACYQRTSAREKQGTLWCQKLIFLWVGTGYDLSLKFLALCTTSSVKQASKNTCG